MENVDGYVKFCSFEIKDQKVCPGDLNDQFFLVQQTVD